ncbi:sigma-70 family RNA polymerase sigma factor [Pseudoalteromonas denitrificans]|uniref:RNA polymerase sigma-70 factor, ECF subfamily n=1 Tax=Pseudoalteromonas denitrificans DSM 6059 TaxID=1123010 RepID=A0A1I1EFB7_9GAMM|nr:sigma-70 family RNA polymerase sigma factor [Pseudoalteromonas denitrificans]SFB83680.1 RNA polymerase sigma-70 factor, ECF subfamily [Pseudoalteromonas denitrificans DSM 6059]
MILSLKKWLNPEIDAETLMSRYAKSGNNDLLKRLIELHADDLYHYLISQSDIELAKDISQKTWLKVIDKREYYQSSGTFKAWLFTVARNALFDEMRKLQRFKLIVDQNIEPELIAIKPLEHNEDMNIKFRQILEQLPFVQREAFVLQQEGFSIAQIADITQQKIETIKTRLRYAKLQFKQHIGA